MRRPGRLVGVTAGAAALVLAGLALAWLLVLRDTAEPASLDDALARYRAEARASDIPIPPGVYVYRTTGSESISALGGTTHRYPRRSTITVTPGPCGMRLRWDVLTTRSTTYEICVEGPRAQRLDGWVERHVFFGRRDETTWRCSGAPWLTGPDGAGTSTSHVCDGGDATQTGATVVSGEEMIPVGSSPVTTLHLRLTAREDGDARGPLVEERWVERETGLPVRIRYTVRTENDSPIGDVTFRERYELALTSLAPRR